MTKEDIIKPENLVAKKPTLMNDNPMHYCPGCSHGVVHKLIAEVIEEMGLGRQSSRYLPGWDAVFIITILILTGKKPHTDADRRTRSSACGRTDWYSLIRETVTACIIR